MIPLLLLLACILLQGLFTGAEMALTAINEERLGLIEAAGAPPRRVKQIRDFLKNPSPVLQSTLLGINLVVVGSATLNVYIVWTRLGDLQPLWVLTLLPATLLVGDVLPKSYFQARAITWAPRLIGVMVLLSRLLRPMLATMETLSRLVTRAKGVDSPVRSFVVREELKLRIQDQTSTPELKPLEREMLSRIFEFREITVGEVMIPLIDVHAISIDRPILDAVQILVEHGHSRVPVYRERVDNVVGVLYAFDLLYESDLGQPVSRFTRQAFYVPHTQLISQLLIELQRKRIGMAIVVDEYGGSEGAITLEDILEEIVGDIEDEYDHKNQKWRKMGTHEYIVAARLELDTLTELTHVQLPEGQFDTVAGFLLWKLGHIPRVGESVRHQNLIFTVRKATERAIHEVSVVISD